MELLLNLSWLLLAMPALWLWRESLRVPDQRRFNTSQRLFCLACALVILFPVVSATDDLRGAGTEMEECRGSKRSISHSTGERVAASKAHTQPALATAALLLVTFEQDWIWVVFPPLSSPVSPAVARTGRAPPQFTVV